jgi:hypothetical protein
MWGEEAHHLPVLDEEINGFPIHHHMCMQLLVETGPLHFELMRIVMYEKPEINSLRPLYSWRR